eukprot:Tamp_07629.p1 GENE.Tamp_07629~~Tamp_07629.p1  ORF type:complete len:339 (-),score=53.17 Tamp_07629:1447-2403(-)
MVSSGASECVEVWVVRHGERVDEVPGVRWDKCGKTNPQWFDPALTGRGHEHAAGVADAIRDKLGGKCPFDVIYTSPLVRTVQTAEKFSERLGIPIEVVPGLCTCAAAIKREGLVQREGRLWLQKSGLPLQTTEELKRLSPNATYTEARTNVDNAAITCSFAECLENLCETALRSGRSEAATGQTASQPRRIMLVAHREGIRELSRVAEGSAITNTPYCCVGIFRYSPGGALPAHGSQASQSAQAASQAAGDEAQESARSSSPGPSRVGARAAPRWVTQSLNSLVSWEDFGGAVDGSDSASSSGAGSVASGTSSPEVLD